MEWLASPGEFLFMDLFKVQVSQKRDRTASGPAGEICPTGSVVKLGITRESSAERSLIPSG